MYVPSVCLCAYSLFVMATGLLFVTAFKPFGYINEISPFHPVPHFYFHCCVLFGTPVLRDSVHEVISDIA